MPSEYVRQRALVFDLIERRRNKVGKIPGSPTKRIEKCGPGSISGNRALSEEVLRIAIRRAAQQDYMNTIEVSSDGYLSWNNKKYHCALGKSGIVNDKKEGDNATPAGCFLIRKIFYRPDRLEKPTSDLPIEALANNDGWCDASSDPSYNTRITFPFSASHESLWRDANLYDLIVVIGYNDNPPVPGKGSAIFIHVARENFTPTAGCIALTLPDLLEIIATINCETKINIEV